MFLAYRTRTVGAVEASYDRAWSIAEVTRASGVSSRTLRHYDDIGLLTPAWTGSNGYRYYEREQLLRLQQILLLRELGVNLSEIAAVLDRQADPVAALRRHHERLIAERDRLTRLADTVACTIAELERAGDGNPDAALESPAVLFDGFDPARHSAEVRRRWGDTPAYREFTGHDETMTGLGLRRLHREHAAVTARMARHLAAGRPADAPEVLTTINDHYHGICRFWRPDQRCYIALGETYLHDPRFAAHYEKARAGLARYMRDAVIAYARARLAQPA